MHHIFSSVDFRSHLSNIIMFIEMTCFWVMPFWSLSSSLKFIFVIVKFLFCFFFFFSCVFQLNTMDHLYTNLCHRRRKRILCYNSIKTACSLFCLVLVFSLQFCLENSFVCVNLYGMPPPPPPPTHTHTDTQMFACIVSIVSVVGLKVVR